MSSDIVVANRDTASPAYEKLAASSRAALEDVFAQANGPEPDALAGWEWRGFNTPRWTRLAGIQKFVKGFDTTASGVEGYNIRVRQGSIQTPWVQRPSPEAPVAFGFFTVSKVPAGALHAGSTLLDYGASRRNRWWRIDDTSMRVLRDYLVIPDPAHPDVVLGKAYFEIFGSLWFSNFFVIERLRPAVWSEQARDLRLPAKAT